ncbi:hypothetical protein AYX14_03092 [Cryptococcus neoformans]|nr:hypothetical protein AYX14_03092 [Cryptococcus neoformans var. grubii]
MAPKRSAPTSKSGAAVKKAKPASKGAKPTSTDSPLDTVKNVASSVFNTVSDAVDVAGDLVLDDGEPAAASEALEETVDVPALKKKGKAAKGKAGETAAQVADKVQESTKPIRGKAAKALKDAQEIDAKAVAERATKAAKDTADAVEKAAKDPENRKKAEDFMEQAENAVKKVADKVGEVLEDTLEQFGEASGITEVAENLSKKGKKQAAKKGKEVAEKAEDVKETGKRKAQKVVEDAGPVTKKTRSMTKVVVEPEPESEQEEDGEDEDVYIHGFSSSDGEADSSDDESDAEDLAVAEAARTVDMGSLPMVAKDDKSVQQRLKKASKKKDDKKGTLYLGRIPHGFYEDQMKEYFSQFGDVTRVRLARNRKTGASKHYAYIEMSSESVAEIVADTMNNYLLMGHLLKCHVIPSDKVHPQLWVGANKKFRKVPRARMEKMKHEKERTEEEKAKADKKLLKKERQRKKKLEAAGIDYEFDGYA